MKKKTESNSNLSTKMKLKLQQQKDRIKPLKYLTFELIGNILILISGILPFVHVFIEDVKLEHKFFGFSSIHKFSYSLGTHLSLFFIVLGLIVLIPTLDKNNIESFKNNLKYSLFSPFISAVFFMTWVFIPGVNFNFLAYTFMASCICFVSIFLVSKLRSYIKVLKMTFLYKEKLVDNGLSYLESKL